MVTVLKPFPLMVTNTPPPVPVDVGVIDEAVRENVSLVTDEVICAKPLFATLTLNV